MGTKWRGMLAPLDTSTGDDRRFISEGFTFRQLPLPLKWQRADDEGHDKSVIVGSMETAELASVADAISKGLISTEAAEKAGLDPDTMAAWGSGELFDDLDQETFSRLLDDVNEAKLLTEKGVIGPSVDCGGAKVALVRVGENTPLTGDELDQLMWDEMETGEPAPIEYAFTAYQVAAATLVSIPAFEQCRPFELITQEQLALVASINSQGWNSLPLADRDMEWDGTAAEKRVADDAGIGGDNPDWSRYARAFLYTDDEADLETKAAYGFQICDIDGAEMMIVPRAVFAVAGVLEGARGGTTIPQADQDQMKEVVSSLYERMADEWDDDTVVAPWDAACGGPKQRKQQQSAAMLTTVTAAVAPRVYDLAPFAPPATPDTGLVPITVTDDGRVFGHIATHDVCHLGIPGVCMTAPVDLSAYDRFHRYQLTGVDGEPIAVGRITYGAGQHIGDCSCCRGNDDHACSQLSMGGAIAHHDQLATVAWVRAWEDTANNAIRVAGVLADNVTVDQIDALARGRVSGDWRSVSGELALVEVLTLSRERPGFPLPRARMAAGQTMSLTAAGTVRRPALSADTGTGLVDYEQLATKIVEVLAKTGVIAPAAAAGEPVVEPDADADLDVASAAAVDAAVADEVTTVVEQLGVVFTDHDRYEADRLVAQMERISGDVLR
jgi:hypothetical protein